MDDKAIRYISLAAKAGKLIVGLEDCEKASGRVKRGVIVLACDAAQNTRKKAASIASAGRVGLVESVYTKWQLAGAIGRGSAVAVLLITDGGLADAFAAAAANATEQEERI